VVFRDASYHILLLSYDGNPHPLSINGLCTYDTNSRLYFYGVRVHIIGRKQAGTLPTPEYIGLSPASAPDGKVFDQIRPVLKQEEVFGDKAYQRPDAADVEQSQQLTVRTPLPLS